MEPSRAESLDARPLPGGVAPGHRQLIAWAVVGAAGSLGLVLTGTRLGALAGGGAGSWWFRLPDAGTTLLGVGFYLSVALLVGAWLGVGRTARRGGLTVPTAWAILAAWAGPLLVGPPLFSKDLYSYVGQGLLAKHGLNPYAVGPAALGHGPVLSSIASVWRHTPAPYGPVFVTIIKFAAGATGGSIAAQVVLLRVLELVGVALVAVALPRLAGRLGADPGMALWLGVLSPLALFSFVASGHNDALMLGLMVLGVALCLEGRPVVGLVLCSLAAAVKLPAALSIAFLAVGALRAAPPGRRLRAAVPFAVVPVVTIVLVTLASGLGWAWLGPIALRIPAELRILSTPAVSVGVLVFQLLHGVGLSVGRSSTVSVVRDLSSVAGIATACWLLWRARTVHVVRLLALALFVVVLTGPTVWPWYLLWGLVLVAATSAQRSRLLAVGAALAMLVVGPSGTPLLQGDAYLVVALAAAIGVGWLVQRRRWAGVVGATASELVPVT